MSRYCGGGSALTVVALSFVFELPSVCYVVLSFLFALLYDYVLKEFCYDMTKEQKENIESRIVPEVRVGLAHAQCGEAYVES